MSAQAELAGIIMSPESFDGGPASCGPGSVYAARIADAILAAGYRKPRTITTPEELDALADRTVVRTAAGSIVNIVGDRAYIFGYESSAPRRTLGLPATVLYEPEATA